MAEEEKNEKKELTGRKGLNFLAVGKYFLIVLIILSQALVAYKIVDSKYEDIYSYMNDFSEEETVIHQMEELIVNPAETNGQRFLVVEISIELPNESFIPRFEKNKQQIKHHMNESLSSRTVNQLVTFEERENLRRELAGIVDSTFGERSVRNLYYTKYVMQ